MRLGDAQMFSLGMEEGARAFNQHREPGEQAGSHELLSTDRCGRSLTT